jgi:hypothetical protein
MCVKPNSSHYGNKINGAEDNVLNAIAGLDRKEQDDGKEASR